nr:hypothetical protein Iba_chr05aCG9790 [Ipomoea batatas]
MDSPPQPLIPLRRSETSSGRRTKCQVPELTFIHAPERARPPVRIPVQQRGAVGCHMTRAYIIRRLIGNHAPAQGKDSTIETEHGSGETGPKLDLDEVGRSSLADWGRKMKLRSGEEALVVDAMMRESRSGRDNKLTGNESTLTIGEKFETCMGGVIEPELNDGRDDFLHFWVAMAFDSQLLIGFQALKRRLPAKLSIQRSGKSSSTLVEKLFGIQFRPRPKLNEAIRSLATKLQLEFSFSFRTQLMLPDARAVCLELGNAS